MVSYVNYLVGDFILFNLFFCWITSSFSNEVRLFLLYSIVRGKYFKLGHIGFLSLKLSYNLSKKLNESMFACNPSISLDFLFSFSYFDLSSNV